MTGPAAAALMLAAAAMLPSPPSRRITPIRPVAPVWAVGWAAGCAVAAIAMSATKTSPAVVISVVVAALTAFVRRRRQRRLRRRCTEARQLQTALDVLIGELRAGAHPVRAFAVAAIEAGATGVGAALDAVAARARLGAAGDAGLRGVAAESALGDHWERLAVCWQLAGEHGLAMSTLMRTAQQDIIERQRFVTRVAAGMAGARATAAILAGLPVVGVLLGQLIGAAPIGVLLGRHAGGWLLLTGVMLTCGGLLWADHITDLEKVVQ